MDEKVVKFHCLDSSKWEVEMQKFLSKLDADGYEIINEQPIEKLIIKIVGTKFKIRKKEELNHDV